MTNKTRMQFSISQEPARLDFVDSKNAFEPSTSEKARKVAEGGKHPEHPPLMRVLKDNAQSTELVNLETSIPLAMIWLLLPKRKSSS